MEHFGGQVSSTHFQLLISVPNVYVVIQDLLTETT
jgi:hypothetical protein